MRYVLVFALVFLFGVNFVYAQGKETAAERKARIDSTARVTKPSRDFLLLQFGYATWGNRPDSIKTKKFGYSFNAYLCYDFPIKKTSLSFAAGLGINTTSIYLNKQTVGLDDTGSAGSAANIYADSTYKKYKFNTAYVSAPFELRYFGNKYNRNKGFKAAIGMQVGTLLGGHTKGLRSVSGTNIKDKENTKRYLSQWNFAATARIGWGNFSLYGSYNLTNVFKDKSGPTLTPMSAGICISGL